MAVASSCRWSRNERRAARRIRRAGDRALGRCGAAALRDGAELRRRIGGAIVSDFGVIIVIEFVLIIGITLVPTFLMGMLFPLAHRDRLGRRDQRRIAPPAQQGAAYAVNTLGTIAGRCSADLC